jgi:hypothetical protein
MKQEADLIRERLKAPRSAAIAGILFSVLLIAGLLLFRLSVRADPLEAGDWLKSSSKTIALALHLIPFAGIAFLWFIGVLRDRLGKLEDRFFATVFLGSGLLFLAMLFASAALGGGFANVHLRPRCHLRGHEPLCGQDGGSIHDLYFHTGNPDRFLRTLVSIPRLCVRAVSPAERALYRVDFDGIPYVGAIDQYLHPD